MARSILYVGDQNPSLPATVTKQDGTVQDLTGYTTVTLAFRQVYDTANKWSAAAAFVNPRTSGQILYNISSTDLAGLTPGVYVAQWILTDASGRPQHLPAGEFVVKKAF